VSEGKWPVNKQDGSVTVQLKFPIMGGNMTSVSIRRPKAGDIRKLKSITDDTERGFELAQALSGMSVEHFDSLDILDLNAISEVVTRMHSKSSE